MLLLQSTGPLMSTTDQIQQIWVHKFAANANLKENKFSYISNLWDGTQHARKTCKQSTQGSILTLHRVIRLLILWFYEVSWKEQ